MGWKRFWVRVWRVCCSSSVMFVEAFKKVYVRHVIFHVIKGHGLYRVLCT